ncbi:DUF6429 family protein [Paenibacillus alkaliterrae]|uniref:DUF6429 family protein n=1 Tax=Paenibacillus alkaliterrae TaxID=320909 RepID=UPI001F196230|nr:DUF6429 family protein [Paenibacillus alkaliterrae]MCF2941702.1 DUF6429 family protein [Paenibacillus alkaliterrae]
MSKNNEQLEQNIKELTLLLLFLTSWAENEGLEKYRRSWKGYSFDILNELLEERLIFGSNRSKSVYFTDAGIEKAKKFASKYLCVTD